MLWKYLSQQNLCANAYFSIANKVILFYMLIKGKRHVRNTHQGKKKMKTCRLGKALGNIIMRVQRLYSAQPNIYVTLRLA